MTDLLEKYMDETRKVAALIEERDGLLKCANNQTIDIKFEKDRAKRYSTLIDESEERARRLRAQVSERDSEIDALSAQLADRDDEYKATMAEACTAGLDDRSH